MSYYDIIENSTIISDNDKYYWGYQYQLADSFIIPYLKQNNSFKSGMSVCEIGCAEGGVLAAFVERGAQHALGTDIAQSRLDIGKIINDELRISFQLVDHNILSDSIPKDYVGQYDLVLLRDVIEHLDSTLPALQAINRLLKPGGRLYVTFPPYYSAYGGHQHTVNTLLGKIPFLHYLPKPLLHSVICNGRKADVGEVMRLKQIRLTPQKFLHAAEDAKFSILHEQYYFIRPVYKMKFGISPISSTPLKHFPLIKDVFSMEAGYVLEKH